MPKPQPDAECIKMAVDITRSAFTETVTLMHKPAQVAEFLETIAYKLADLRFGERQ
jgi:hypothetical protein